MNTNFSNLKDTVNSLERAILKTTLGSPFGLDRLKHEVVTSRNHHKLHKESMSKDNRFIRWVSENLSTREVSTLTDSLRDQKRYYHHWNLYGIANAKKFLTKESDTCYCDPFTTQVRTYNTVLFFTNEANEEEYILQRGYKNLGSPTIRENYNIGQLKFNLQRGEAHSIIKVSMKRKCWVEESVTRTISNEFIGRYYSVLSALNDDEGMIPINIDRPLTGKLLHSLDLDEIFSCIQSTKGIYKKKMGSDFAIAGESLFEMAYLSWCVDHGESLSYKIEKLLGDLDPCSKFRLLSRSYSKMLSASIKNWKYKRLRVDISYLLVCHGYSPLSGIDKSIKPTKIVIGIQNSSPTGSNKWCESTLRCLDKAKLKESLEEEDPEIHLLSNEEHKEISKCKLILKKYLSVGEDALAQKNVRKRNRRSSAEMRSKTASFNYELMRRVSSNFIIERPLKLVYPGLFKATMNELRVRPTVIPYEEANFYESLGIFSDSKEVISAKKKVVKEISRLEVHKKVTPYKRVIEEIIRQKREEKRLAPRNEKQNVYEFLSAALNVKSEIESFTEPFKGEEMTASEAGKLYINLKFEERQRINSSKARRSLIRQERLKNNKRDLKIEVKDNGFLRLGNVVEDDKLAVYINKKKLGPEFAKGRKKKYNGLRNYRIRNKGESAELFKLYYKIRQRDRKVIFRNKYSDLKPTKYGQASDVPRDLEYNYTWDLINNNRELAKSFGDPSDIRSLAIKELTLDEEQAPLDFRIINERLNGYINKRRLERSIKSVIP